jgi:hypothetical protein
MRKIALFVLLAALAGCATNPTRESALLLVDQIDEYEKAISAKVAAEQTYYAQTRTTLQDQARRQALREQQRDYLVGITEITDQAMVRDRGLQASAFQEFLRGLNETGRNSEEERSRREAELRAVYQVNFKALSSKRSELARTRSQLLQLSREKSTTEQLRRFLQESAQRAIELNEQENEGSN